MFLPSKLAPNAGETLIFEDTLQIQAILTLFGKACSTPAMCASTQAATKLKSVQKRAYGKRVVCVVWIARRWRLRSEGVRGGESRLSPPVYLPKPEDGTNCCTGKSATQERTRRSIAFGWVWGESLPKYSKCRSVDLFLLPLLQSRKKLFLLQWHRTAYHDTGPGSNFNAQEPASFTCPGVLYRGMQDCLNRWAQQAKIRNKILQC